MIPYFDNQENRDRLLATVDSWMNVPYFHMGISKNGVDCTKFVGLVCVDMGILQDIDRNVYYPRDWHIHGNIEVVRQSMDEHFAKYLNPGLVVQSGNYCLAEELAQGEQILIGDMLLLATQTNLCNHTAIYLGNGTMVHCMQRRGVIVTEFSRFLKTKCKFYYRVYLDQEEQEQQQEPEEDQEQPEEPQEEGQ